MPSLFSSRSKQNSSPTGENMKNESRKRIDPYGIAILANPQDAFVDIIFVHGLTGNREDTWTYQQHPRTFWPRDLLPEEVRRARIMTWGYDADITRIGIKTAGSNTLIDHGKNLATDVAMWRRRSLTPSDRPIIFVSHSLGGLVVEQAILVSRGATELYLCDILEATHGIIFMGTPHMGADLAKWGKLLANLGEVLIRTNREIVAVLEPTSEMLAKIQEDFHGLLKQRSVHEDKRMKLYCFYEELEIRVIGKVVDKHSAILSSEESAAIHGTHITMTKFRDANDAMYKRVSDQIWLWVDELQRQTQERSSAKSKTCSQGVNESATGNPESRRGQLTIGNTWNGPVNSGSGSVYQGNTASRDFIVSSSR